MSARAASTARGDRETVTLRTLPFGLTSVIPCSLARLRPGRRPGPELPAHLLERRGVDRVQGDAALGALELVVPLDLARQVDALDAALGAAGADGARRLVHLVLEGVQVGELAHVERQEE